VGTGTSTWIALLSLKTVSGTFSPLAILWIRYWNLRRRPSPCLIIPWSSMSTSPILVMTSHFLSG
jgi:hypothetical protein